MKAGPSSRASNTRRDKQRESAANAMAPLLHEVLHGSPPVPIEFWDGSTLDAGGSQSDGPERIHIRSPNALRHLVWAPGELGFARAFVDGDITFDGRVTDVLRAVRPALSDSIGSGLRAMPAAIASVVKLGGFGPYPTRPPEESALHGLRHSIGRDKQAINHHHDVGNDFYDLILGPSMTYSCARFDLPGMSLEDAQRSKHELVCRKLGLAEPSFVRACPGDRPRLLDVGCGWGAMAIHAATHHGADVVGVTISERQAAAARERVVELGLADRIDIRLQDYREVRDGPFDAISSIGMAEHVGHRNMDRYFGVLYRQLRPGGRLLNHAIASIGGSTWSPRSFVSRYVFPDGELLDLGDTVLSMHRAGFEVRDVEGLREHYTETLRHWLDNLESNWPRAIDLVGERRARVWQLYLSGSINGFEDGSLLLYQTLGVKNAAGGVSRMPPSRALWS